MSVSGGIHIGATDNDFEFDIVIYEYLVFDRVVFYRRNGQMSKTHVAHRADFLELSDLLAMKTLKNVGRLFVNKRNF
jgi:hypothetical protein